MQRRKRRRSDRAGRPAMRSPGRPPATGRAEQQRFWKAIARGLSSEDAAVSCGVSPPVGGRWFREGGGMPPISLAPRSARYLSLAEREEIAILRAQGAGVRDIARRLRRAPSTVSRELRRTAATRSGGLAYRASTAQWHSARRAKRPKIAKLAANDRLRSYVQDRLAGTVMAEDGTPVPGPNVGSWSGRRHGRRQDRHWATSWSPQQIAHRLRIEYPDDDSMRVSHEAIYQALYIQGRGALRRELTACLRTGRALRAPMARRRGRGKECVGPDIMISERPAEADDRAVPGHWEGDLIIGLGVAAHRGVARRGSDRAGWRTRRPQRPVSRRAPSWEQPRDGRVGRPARADSRAPDSPCHGAREFHCGRTKRCMAIAPSMTCCCGACCMGSRAARTRRPPRRFPGRSGCLGRPCPGRSSRPARPSSASSKSGTCPGRTSSPWCWTARPSPSRRWSSRWASR